MRCHVVYMLISERVHSDADNATSARPVGLTLLNFAFFLARCLNALTDKDADSGK